MPLLECKAALLIAPAYTVAFAAMVCKPGAELSLLVRLLSSWLVLVRSPAREHATVHCRWALATCPSLLQGRWIEPRQIGDQPHPHHLPGQGHP